MYGKNGTGLESAKPHFQNTGYKYDTKCPLIDWQTYGTFAMSVKCCCTLNVDIGDGL